jgi:hypothetical protein
VVMRIQLVELSYTNFVMSVRINMLLANNQFPSYNRH